MLKYIKKVMQSVAQCLRPSHKQIPLLTPEFDHRADTGFNN